MAYVGIDIGATTIVLRAVFGDVVREHTVRLPDTRILSDDVDAFSDGVEFARSGWPDTVTSVGIAVPGTVSDAGTIVTWPYRPHWVGLDFTALTQKLFPGAKVAHEGDGDLAAVAEAAVAGCSDLVYLGVGTGINGGLVVGGRPLCEHRKGTCGIGHMIIDRYGEPCVCGRRGCVQAVASGPATLNRASRRRGGSVDFAELCSGLERDQMWAVSAVDDGCMALAAATTNLTELLRPSLVVIGGGFAAAIDGFVDRVIAHTEAFARPGQPAVPIKPAAHGGLSSLHGAVILAQRP